MWFSPLLSIYKTQTGQQKSYCSLMDVYRGKQGRRKKKSKAGFLMFGYRLLPLIIFLSLLPQLTLTFNSQRFFSALLFMPGSLPCLTCDMLMLHSCSNPLWGLHDSRTNRFYIHGFLIHFPILILLPPVPVIIIESTAWLLLSSLWHWMQNLTLLQRVLWYVYAHLLSPLSLFPSLYMYFSPLKVVEHYLVYFYFLLLLEFDGVQVAGTQHTWDH